MILFGALVAAIWVFLLSRLDPHRRGKGSLRLLALFLFGGVASAFACWVPYLLSDLVVRNVSIYNDVAWEFFYNFLVVGPIEEGTKFVFFFALTHQSSTIREPGDGLLQAAAVGLGFAVTENVGYGWAHGFDTMLVLARLPRESARSLVRSIGPLAPERALRDRLRDVVVECGGPAPWDEWRRPTPVFAWEDVIARRGLKRSVARLEQALAAVRAGAAPTPAAAALRPPPRPRPSLP